MHDGTANVQQSVEFGTSPAVLAQPVVQRVMMGVHAANTSLLFPVAYCRECRCSSRLKYTQTGIVLRR